ncbi:thioesterase [Sulfitobacter sp. JL08]|nr:acyl-CoA thioesterase [Sulfitobacter sp. JL08]AXI54767.1 thioesterase [Sulfitobacter sp. JL08]
MNLPYHTPLTPDQQRAAGLQEPQPMAIADRVRFAELDVLNHVNNKAYMTWFETLRVEYFNRLARPYYDDDQPRPRIVLGQGTVRYIKEMLMGEDYVTTCRVKAFRNTSCTMEQQLWSGDLRAVFTCVSVLLMPDGSGRMPLPDALKQRFLDVDGAIAE